MASLCSDFEEKQESRRQTARLAGLDMYSFADFHAHSVGKQDDFVTPSSLLSFFLFLAMHKLPFRERRNTAGEQRREGERRDGKQGRANQISSS